MTNNWLMADSCCWTADGSMCVDCYGSHLDLCGPNFSSIV